LKFLYRRLLCQGLLLELERPVRLVLELVV
jgi:hypothetical protein